MAQRAKSGSETADLRSPARTPVWIKAFVAFHLVAITVWSLPNPGERLLKGDVRAFGTDILLVLNGRHLKTLPPIRAYVTSTGFWQYWDMFAPNPAQTDYYGTALVTYRDGSTRTYQYPRMYLLPIPQKHGKERYRKFYERAHMESHEFFWRPFALRVAVKNFDDPNNPPVRVDLIRHWREIAKPGQKQLEDYNQYKYYVYEVDAIQLRRGAEARPF